MRSPNGYLLAIINDIGGSLTTRYTVLDGQGSVIAQTTGSGTIDDTTKYDPYGIVISHTGTDYNPFQYTSSYTDSSTGLIHDGARYYNPADGRFTQQDPAGQGPDLYGYASGNPVTGADPSGLGILSALTDVVGALQDATSLDDLVNDIGTSSFASDVESIAVGVGTEFACNVILGFADVPTAGAATAVGEAGCFILGTEASNAVG